MSAMRVEIAAAGEGSRLRSFMTAQGYNPESPKHLLTTGNPNNETLLGRIVRQALAPASLEPPVIYASPANARFIAEHPDIDRQAEIRTPPSPGPFDRYMDRLVVDRQTTLGASGDHYAEQFSWADLLRHHDSNPFPITLVMAQCVAVNEGAVFNIGDSGRVTRFYRAERTTPDDLLNVGLYVMEPGEAVSRSIEAIGITPETIQAGLSVDPEALVTRWIESGLTGAYVLPPGTAYNINTPEAYGALLNHTADQQHAK